MGLNFLARVREAVNFWRAPPVYHLEAFAHHDHIYRYDVLQDYEEEHLSLRSAVPRSSQPQTEEVFTPHFESLCVEIRRKTGDAVRAITASNAPEAAERMAFCWFAATYLMQVPWDVYIEDDFEEEVHKRIRQLRAHDDHVHEALESEGYLSSLTEDEERLYKVMLMRAGDLFLMHWSRLYAPTEESYITADMPALVIDSGDGRECHWRHARAEVTLPLSPNLLLLAGWNNELDYTVNVSAKTVRRHRFAHAYYAKRYIYAATPMPELIRNLRAVHL
ncbi:MAG: DUF4238 domain-containing protein [Holosporales bacterium]